MRVHDEVKQSLSELRALAEVSMPVLKFLVRRCPFIDWSRVALSRRPTLGRCALPVPTLTSFLPYMCRRRYEHRIGCLFVEYVGLALVCFIMLFFLFSFSQPPRNLEVYVILERVTPRLARKKFTNFRAPPPPRARHSLPPCFQ